MKLIDILVDQCRKPTGLPGILMAKIINIMDAGLNIWVLRKIENSKNILEVGCGGGETIYRILKKYKIIRMEGIDYSEDAVKLSQRKNRHSVMQGQVCIRQCDVTKLPFEALSFDSILAIRTHYFWTDLETSLKELYRVLIDNGVLYIFSEKSKIKYHMYDYNTEESLGELLYCIGFKKVTYEYRRDCICISAYK